MESIYKALPLLTYDSIRLLTFDGVDPDGTVRVSLHVARLNERPQFRALSYAWHSPDGHSRPLPLQQPEHNQKKLIRCNSRHRPVLENLADALAMLANSCYAKEAFWVDYLCIDQMGEANADEQAQQVSIMAWIYSQAEVVFAWLGPHMPTVDLHAIRLIKLIAEASPEQLDHLMPSRIDTEQARQLVGEELQGMNCWQCLARFLAKSWFRRAWVVQEVLNAQRLILFCGGNEVDWDQVATVSGFLSTTPWAFTFHRANFLCGLNDLVPNHGGPAKLRATQREQSSHGTSSLLYSLVRARKYDCQDERDKVYSLVGSRDPSVPIPSLLSINYNSSSQVVYTNAAIHILETSSDLLLLAYCEGQDYRSHKLLNLPSWVPDWSITDVVGLGVTGYKRYNAAGDRPRFLRVRPPDQVSSTHYLEVETAYFDRITEVGERKSEVCRNGALCPGWLDIVIGLGETYITGERTLDVLWRTLVTDTVTADQRPVHPAPASTVEAFKQWIASVPLRNQDSQHQASVGDTAAFNARLNTLCADISFKDGAMADHYAAALSHAECLRLFRTERGYLGLGTTSLRVGDSVCIVAASRIPLIFRPCDERDGQISSGTPVQLVGGTYVHGIMHGEFLPDEKSWKKLVVL